MAGPADVTTAVLSPRSTPTMGRRTSGTARRRSLTSTWTARNHLSARRRTRPDRISALGYTRRVLATALADIAALDAATVKPERARRDLLDEIERERQAQLDEVEREQYVAPPPPPPAAGPPRREIPRGRRR